jgi:hypothetical protein
VFSVVSGGIGTLVVVAIVAMKWRVLMNVPPLHTLRPEVLTPQPVRETVAEPAGARAAGA